MLSTNQLGHRACPVCGGGNSKLLFEQHFEQLSGAQLLDGYSIVVCRDCGVAFADRIPEQAVFDDYYREFSKYEGGEPEAAALRKPSSVSKMPPHSSPVSSRRWTRDPRDRLRFWAVSLGSAATRLLQPARRRSFAGLRPRRPEVL